MIFYFLQSSPDFLLNWTLIENFVHFTGYLKSSEAIHAALDSADIFVLPSLAEGLPKVTIEAMARALPCIGSQVGGQVELLSEGYLVPAGDVQALKSKLCAVSGDLSRLNQMSACNFEKAQEYHQEILSEHRQEFYEYIFCQTEKWEKQKQKFPSKKNTEFL